LIMNVMLIVSHKLLSKFVYRNWSHFVGKLAFQPAFSF